MIKNIIKKGIKIKEIQEKIVTKEKTNICENIKLAYVITMCIIIIFSLPFIYTIFANILIKNQIIESIEQLEKCNNIFVAFNILLVVAFIILILYECNVSPTYIFNKIISNFDISYKKGDSEFHAKNMTYEYDSQEIKRMTEDSKQEMKEQIQNVDRQKVLEKCEKCKIEEVISERESFRFFSAYQVTNKYSRELLKQVMLQNQSQILIESFAGSIKEYYMKTIKNMGKNKREEFATKKVQELIYNLRYINIIELSEDGNFIILTETGKEFVKGYNEEVG